MIHEIYVVFDVILHEQNDYNTDQRLICYLECINQVSTCSLVCRWADISMKSIVGIYCLGWIQLTFEMDIYVTQGVLFES